MNNTQEPVAGSSPATCWAVCPLCAKLPSHITGTERRCAFPNGVFSPDNWNCGTGNALRDLVKDPIWDGDQHLGILRFPDQGRFIILSWYKSRGKIDTITMNFDDQNGPLTIKGAMVLLGLEPMTYEDDVLMLPNAKADLAGGSEP